MLCLVAHLPMAKERRFETAHLLINGDCKSPLTATPELFINLLGRSLDLAPHPHRGRL
jgi:hypothetical protein